MTTHNYEIWRVSLLLSVSHSQETSASAGDETPEEDCLSALLVWCFSVASISEFLHDIPLKSKKKFSSIFISALVG